MPTRPAAALLSLLLVLSSSSAFAKPSEQIDAMYGDFWNWLKALLESEDDEELPPAESSEATAQTESIQDESRSFTSIIR